MSDERREALDAAFEQVEETDETEVEETVPSEEVAGEESSETVPEEPEEPEDDGGTEEVPPIAAEDAGTPAEDAEPPGESTPTSEYESAPQGWKATAREAWASVPEEIRAEVHRREANIRDVLQETADQRKFAEDFNQMVRPYEPLIAHQNSTPMQAAENFFKTAAGLTLGTQQQKAQIISNIIQQYGVDIGELDNVLSAGMEQGTVPNAQDSQLATMLDQRLAPITQFMGEIQQGRQQYNQDQQTNAESELATFAQNHEFFEDVREDMADLLDLAASRKQTMTLEQAYERALLLHDDIQAVIKQRHEAAGITQTNEDLSGKEAASVSVPSAPPTDSSSQGPATRRGALEQAIAEAEAR